MFENPCIQILYNQLSYWIKITYLFNEHFSGERLQVDYQPASPHANPIHRHTLAHKLVSGYLRLWAEFSAQFPLDEPALAFHSPATNKLERGLWLSVTTDAVDPEYGGKNSLILQQLP